WGFNQYIIQRALAAKDLPEAQKGIIFASFLKLLMPVIIVLPGIAAVLLAPGLPKPDEAYPTMMALLPTGLLGLVFAALIAAITVIFLLGLFWKRANEAGAICAAVSSVLLSWLFKSVWGTLPFMDRMGVVFLIALALAVVVSLVTPGKADTDTIETADVRYAT